MQAARHGNDPSEAVSIPLASTASGPVRDDVDKYSKTWFGRSSVWLHICGLLQRNVIDVLRARTRNNPA